MPVEMAGPRGANVSAPWRATTAVFLLAVLPVALADVVAAGDAEDGGARLLGRNVLHRFSDHHHQLALVMNVGGAVGDDDGLIGSCSAVTGL